MTPASALVKGRHNRIGQIMLSVEPVLAHVDSDFDQAVERLCDTGAGSKTVIPAQASAKFSCRLVAGQDPHKILAGIKEFLGARTPLDARWEIKTFSSSPAIKVPVDSPHLQRAMAGLADIYGKPPVLIGAGGSIPVVGYIQQILGFDSILVGFGLEDDLIHSPNEKFELKCFHNGIRSHAAILARMAGS
jgi:acetylornithine deacetylase/succinyl-diaminopimelate desuccinylase-like protein